MDPWRLGPAAISLAVPLRAGEKGGRGAASRVPLRGERSSGMDAPTSEPLALQEKVLTQKTDFILKALAKKYFALCAEADGEDGEAAQAAQAAFLKELHLFEFEVGKAKRIRGANQR